MVFYRLKYLCTAVEMREKLEEAQVWHTTSCLLTVHLSPYLPTPRNCCKTVTFGSCWLSQLLWLSGKQFCLPCVLAENSFRVQWWFTFAGDCSYLPCWASQTGRGSQKGTFCHRQLSCKWCRYSTNQSPWYYTLLSGVMRDSGFVLWQFIQRSPRASRGISLH